MVIWLTIRGIRHCCVKLIAHPKIISLCRPGQETQVKSCAQKIAQVSSDPLNHREY